MTARTLTLRGASYPLVLPSLRDPRLHVAAVIISVHVLGQVGLGFRVSVPQILAAILTCAVLEVALTFRQSRAFVWPASAMLTGSGVALILRLVGTPPSQPWAFEGWYVFAAIAGLSLLSKYVIKYRGTHVFNPSNIGLVVAFVVLGSTRIEPLDFWWAPLNAWMVAAYGVILVGGLLITRRLKLLAMAAAFWLTLAAGIGLLAVSGHCMTTNWAFAPVCGFDFWRVIVSSPEVMIFLFFMITDPKTVPTGRVGRVVFAVLVGIVSVVLMAPQTDEFGSKVGLLAGLVIVCAARPLVDRLVPAPKSAGDELRSYAASAGPVHGVVARSVAGLALMALVGGVVLAAGTPARGSVLPNAAEALNRPLPNVDPGTLPPISVGQDVIDYDHELAGTGMQPVVLSLAQDLELENVALLERNGDLLRAIDHGDRLVQMQARLEALGADGATTVTRYRFDTISVSLLVPFGRQDGLSLGLAARGTAVEERHDAGGALLSSHQAPFDLTFAVRQATGSRWMLVAVLEPDEVPG
jgi:Na+-translocating ferredoxin:NAD+ oxidoreductase RnfD subunit